MGCTQSSAKPSGPPPNPFNYKNALTSFEPHKTGSGLSGESCIPRNGGVEPCALVCCCPPSLSAPVFACFAACGASVELSAVGLSRLGAPVACRHSRGSRRHRLKPWRYTVTSSHPRRHIGRAQQRCGRRMAPPVAPSCRWHPCAHND